MDECDVVLATASVSDFKDALTSLINALFVDWPQYALTDVAVTCDADASRRRSDDGNSSVMAAVGFALNAEADQDRFVSVLTTAVEDNTLTISTTAYSVVATEAILRQYSTTAAPDSTAPATSTSTDSSDTNPEADSSTNSDEGIFSGFTLYVIIGAAALLLLLAICLCTIARARRNRGDKRALPQVHSCVVPPDNSGWNSNSNTISLDWRSDVRPGPPKNRPPATHNPTYATARAAEPVAAPRPGSVAADYVLAQQEQKSGADQILYATTDDASSSVDAPRPEVIGDGVVESRVGMGSNRTTPSPQRPFPVLRLERPSHSGLSEDELSFRMESIRRPRRRSKSDPPEPGPSIRLGRRPSKEFEDAADRGEDAGSISNPSFSAWGDNANQLARDLGVTVVDDEADAQFARPLTTEWPDAPTAGKRRVSHTET